MRVGDRFTARHFDVKSRFTRIARIAVTLSMLTGLLSGIVVALTGFGNIKSGAFIAAAVGLVDTAGRFLAPTYGSFCVYFFLIGMMVWQNIRTADP